MDHLLDAVRSALRAENWYAALSLALTLPDICGAIETPKEGVRARYERWCAEYLVHRYVQRFPSPSSSQPGHLRSRFELSGYTHVFMTATDVYGLRCALLHEGSDSIERHAKAAIRSFRFVAVEGGGRAAHCNQFNDQLQLDVTSFCEEIIDSVKEWLRTTRDDPLVYRRIQNLMKVEVGDGTVAFG